MTESDWKYAEQYIRLIADQMHLHDWKLVVDRAPCDEENSAQIRCTPQRRVAHVALSAEFRSVSPTEQRNTIVHELLHVHWAFANDVLERDLCASGLLGTGPMALLMQSYNRMHEYAVDAIAAAIDHTFPVPTWPRRRGKK